jgi:predicted transcriptional regulator
VGTSDKNSIPEGSGSQGGGRIALLPQKSRKFYSFKAVKKALSDRLWKQAYVPVNVFLLFAKRNGKRKPVGACLGADPRTIARIFNFAREHDLAVLHLGIFFLRKETAEKLRENRKIAKGDREKLAQLDLHAISGANKLVRLAFRVFIDIDNKDTKALWRLIKYLWKLKIYPEVWETQKGYHVYIYFYHRKVYRVVSVEDEDGKKRVEKVFQGYELPFAKDYRIKHVRRGLKELCSKVGVKADIVSASHSVWVEGIPNPLKDGFATKLILNGKPLSLEDLWQKTLPLWLPKELFRRPRYRVRKPKNEEKAEDALRELDKLLEPPYSNVFFALSRHGTLKACRQLWKAGYDLSDIEDELKNRLEIRTESDKEALQNFLKYFEEHYTDTPKPQARPQKEKERKHEHYWELAPKVREALEKGYLKTTHIARYLGCTRDRVKKFKSFLKTHGYSLEDLLTRYEEVMAFLKAHAKGGNKAQRKKEWDREAWLEEYQRREAEFIQRCKEEAEIRRAKKREELEAKGIDPDGWYSWWQIPVWFYPAGSGTIGNTQFVGGGKEVEFRAGSILANRPPRTSKKKTNSSPPRAGRNKLFTPAVPLVILSRDYSTKLRDALYEVLQRYHSEDGLPVVLVVPSRFSDTGSTSLKLTPYKVPPRNFRQLWQEIREKFGKTVQGLSTRNGALDWFLKVWEQVKDKTTLVSVPSTPFPIKKEKPSVLSYLLSAKQLLAKQTEPPEKKDEKKDNHYGKAVLSRAEIAELMRLFQAHPDKKISELLPYMPERARRVLKQVKRELKQELDHLSELKAKGELPPLLQKIEGFVRFWVARFPVLFDPPVVFRRLFDAILRNYEKIYGPDPVFLELRRVGSFAEFMTKTVYLQEQLRALETQKPKREPKKLKLPPSKVIEDVVRFFEGRRSQVSRQELETTIYAAWRKVDKDKADRLAVSRYIDRYEGVLWRKLNNGHYVLLVSSDETETRIRNYVLELKQAKKNGQGQTSADGNGSLGSQSSNGNNGNGKYDIEQITHTLQKEGKVYVPPQFVHEIVRELRRRGFSVNYWTTTGLIELAGGDDELPF